MLITLSFKKSLIVEQFQGNYLNIVLKSKAKKELVFGHSTTLSIQPLLSNQLSKSQNYC